MAKVCLLVFSAWQNVRDIILRRVVLLPLVDLDVTIQGDGWISVMDNTGREGLTRNGKSKVD